MNLGNDLGNAWGNAWRLVRALVTLAVLDAIYLSTYGQKFSQMMVKIQGKPISLKVPPTIVVYVLIFVAWTYFIYNVRNRYSMRENVLRGFILGVTTYGIYDFTNMATIDGWSLTNVIVDTLWGGILYALVTLVALI